MEENTIVNKNVIIEKSFNFILKGIGHIVKKILQRKEWEDFINNNIEFLSNSVNPDYYNKQLRNLFSKKRIKQLAVQMRDNNGFTFYYIVEEEIRSIISIWDVNDDDKKRLICTLMGFIEKQLREKHPNYYQQFVSDNIYKLAELNNNKLREILEKIHLLTNKDNRKFKEKVRDSIEALNDKSEFNDKIGESFSYDLTKQIEKINISKNKFTLVYGESGSGKSVLCVKALAPHKNILYTKATKLLAVKDVDEIWGFSLNEVFSSNKEDIYIYVDALEFISDNLDKLDNLKVLLNRVNAYRNIRFLCSCRTCDMNSFNLIIQKYRFYCYSIKELDDSILQNIVLRFPVLQQLRKNNKYSKLLRKPFYINFLTKLPNISSIENENDLRNMIWTEIICKGDNKIAQTVISIARDRAKDFVVYVKKENYNTKIINDLISRDILSSEGDSIRLRYDIFEDICIERYIDEKFDECKCNYSSFFISIESIGKCIYRRYQIWIENKLFEKKNRDYFLSSLIFDSTISKKWKKQTEIGIIKSNYCNSFFDEYSQALIDNNSVIEFINITNVYGFELNSELETINLLAIRTCGQGRNSLVKIVYNYNLYKSKIFDSCIKTLVFDYCHSINKNLEISKFAFEIVKYYLDEVLKYIDDNKIYDKFNYTKPYLKSIYELSPFSSKWIKEHFESLKNQVIMKNSRYAIDVIEDIISVNNVCLSVNNHIELLDLYGFYYTYKEKGSLGYHSNSLEHIEEFGLNNNASYFRYKKNTSPEMSDVFFALLKKHYWLTLKWYIGFLNDRILSLQLKVKLNTYNLNVLGSNKVFYGFDRMWMVGEVENKFPRILEHLTYLVKKETLNIVKILKKDKAELVKFCDNLKNMIYTDSNNIIPISILSNVGFEVFDDYPGYCLDLASSTDILACDAEKFISLQNEKHPLSQLLTREFLKKSFMGNIEVNRYKDNLIEMNIFQYVLNTQSLYPDMRDFIYQIIDRLYEEVNISKDLMDVIKQMDYRNIKQTYNQKVSSESSVEKVQEKKSFNEIYKERMVYIAKVLKRLTENKVSMNDLDIVINDLYNQKDDIIFSQSAEYLIHFIFYALSKFDLKEEIKNKYIDIWVSILERHFEKGDIVIDKKRYYYLFNLLNSSIDNERKNRIKDLIASILLSNGIMDGTKYEIVETTQLFLSNNCNIAKIVFNTIIMLALDNMAHQKYNYDYLKTYYPDEVEEFVPNVTSRLLYVDNTIRNDKKTLFVSHFDEIITNYLHDEQELKITNYSIEDYDINTLSVAISSGLSITDDVLCKFIKEYIMFIIKIFHTKRDYELSEIHPFEYRDLVIDFLKKNLRTNNYKIVVDLLFEMVDCNEFTNDSIKFYNNILCTLTGFYFDSYNSIGNRKIVMNVVYELEKRIAPISLNSVKKELSKSLILAFDEYGGGGDWSKFKSEYYVQDKHFLKEQFSKYGYLNFIDLLNVIYHFKYTEMLPEMLIPLADSLEKFFSSDIYKVDKKYINSIFESLNQILFYSLNCCEKLLKENVNYSDAFERISNILVEHNNTKASVLLMEFFSR